MRLLAIAMLIGLSLAACQRADGGDVAPMADDRAVARVDGRAIWTSDVRREAAAQGLIGDGEALETSSALFSRVLDEVIDQKLMAAEAERRGLDDDPAAQRRLAATQEHILADLLVEGVVDDAVTDQAVEALYQEQLRQGRPGEELRVRLILSRTRSEAEAVRGLLGAGADFVAVAAQRSTDPATRASGGDLGWTTLDVLPDAYAQALAGAQPGTVTAPIRAEAGWAVLRVDARRVREPPTLDQERPQLIRLLTYDRVRQLLEQLRGRAEIEHLIEGPAPAAPAKAAKAAP